MDFLRSCYASQWRLVAGHPEVITPGYYYFNDNAPFFPGPTNLGSGVWTSDDFSDPPLGEAKTKRAYRKGGLPIPVPPPVLVGTADCLAAGETYPLPVVSRTLPAGVDGRCYSLSALAVPDPSPALWLRPKALPKLLSNSPVFSWPDSSVYGRDATSAGPVYPGYDSTDFTTAGVAYSLNARHTIPPFSVAGDFAVFAVGILGVTGPGVDPVVPVCDTNPVSGLAPMRIGSSGLGTVTSAGIERFAINGGEGVLRLYTIRRVGNNVTAYLRDALVGTFTDPNPRVFTPGTVAYWAFGPAGQQFFLLVELQVYDQPLSDPGFASIQAGIIASYGL